MIMIHRSMLQASDFDSNPKFVLFNITKFPVAGEIQKMRNWESVGFPVTSFYQSDLNSVRSFFLLIHFNSLLFKRDFERNVNILTKQEKCLTFHK